MKGGGGNVPFLVTGAEDFVKEERPSPWAKGLKLCWRRSHRGLGTTPVKSIIIEEAGEESAPSSPNPHGAASHPDGSEKSQERG